MERYFRGFDDSRFGDAGPALADRASGAAFIRDARQLSRSSVSAAEQVGEQIEGVGGWRPSSGNLGSCGGCTDGGTIPYALMEVEMLELLDTGRIAHKLGKWRWTAYFATGLCLFLVGWAIAELLRIPSLMSPAAAADSSLAFWTFVGFSLLALLLILYSFWLGYIDEMRGTYIKDAQHYKTHGW